MTKHNTLIPSPRPDVRKKRKADLNGPDLIQVTMEHYI